MFVTDMYKSNETERICVIHKYVTFHDLMSREMLTYILSTCYSENIEAQFYNVNAWHVFAFLDSFALCNN
jgi:hypothetical protein